MAGSVSLHEMDPAQLLVPRSFSLSGDASAFLGVQLRRQRHRKAELLAKLAELVKLQS